MPSNRLIIREILGRYGALCHRGRWGRSRPGRLGHGAARPAAPFTWPWSIARCPTKMGFTSSNNSPIATRVPHRPRCSCCRPIIGLATAPAARPWAWPSDCSSRSRAPGLMPRHCRSGPAARQCPGAAVESSPPLSWPPGPATEHPSWQKITKTTRCFIRAYLKQTPHHLTIAENGTGGSRTVQSRPLQSRLDGCANACGWMGIAPLPACGSGDRNSNRPPARIMASDGQCAGRRSGKKAWQAGMRWASQPSPLKKPPCWPLFASMLTAQLVLDTGGYHDAQYHGCRPR